MARPVPRKRRAPTPRRAPLRTKPTSTRTTRTPPAPSPGRSPIKHVVIIVRENHAFDNYFGRFPGANGVTLPESPNPPPQDPDHTHEGWLVRDTNAVRQQFTEAQIPAYWACARAYTLCDNYFTDVAGPSTPNHLMLIAADSPIVDNPSHYRLPKTVKFALTSLPAQLDTAGRTWRKITTAMPSTSSRASPGRNCRRSSSPWMRRPATCRTSRGCMRIRRPVSIHGTRGIRRIPTSGM